MTRGFDKLTAGVLDWLDTRSGYRAGRSRLLDEPLPAGTGWWFTLGSLLLFGLAIQVVTGIVLAFYYAPTPDHAWDSVRYITTQVRGGSLLRGLHHWAATVVVVPSPHESLSLLALESFAVGTPILANARSEVLVDHCLKSNAGLFYADQDEFNECLNLLLSDDRLRAGMGRNGRNYIKQNYRWDVIMQKYDRLISKLRG